MVKGVASRSALLAAMAALLLLQSGCSVYSSQARFLKKVFFEDREAIAKYEWHVELGDYTATIYAVNSEPNIAFGNYLGDAIVFDGWTLKEIHGMGLFRYRWDIVSKDNYRMFYEVGEFQGSYQCFPWRIAQGDGESLNLIQQCKGAGALQYVNVIELDSERSVQKIKWDIIGEDAPLVITRVNHKK